MTDINGYLKDMTGKAVGIASNPIYVTLSSSPATVPQEFKPEIHYRIIETPKFEYIVAPPAKPKGFFGSIWWNVGKCFGWC
jgi:hypothetical protein